LNTSFIEKHWYAAAYEQFETQTNDVEFILSLLGEEPQNILEVACGGGRICIPTALAGHHVTAFDYDAHRLLHCYRKAQGLPNISIYQADAIDGEWGNNYDVVLMAGNLLINIESSLEYSQAQQLFIHHAAAALRSGGRLLLDYDQHSTESAMARFNYQGQSEGQTYHDDLDTAGKDVYCGGIYDPVTQICAWVNHRELKTNNGKTIIRDTRGYKHIPSLTQVYAWLSQAGLTIERTFKGYSEEPLCETETKHVRATILAKKD